jgi:hypothetical protein
MWLKGERLLSHNKIIPEPVERQHLTTPAPQQGDSNIAMPIMQTVLTARSGRQYRADGGKLLDNYGVITYYPALKRAARDHVYPFGKDATRWNIPSGSLIPASAD